MLLGTLVKPPLAIPDTPPSGIKKHSPPVCAAGTARLVLAQAVRVRRVQALAPVRRRGVRNLQDRRDGRSEAHCRLQARRVADSRPHVKEPTIDEGCGESRVGEIERRRGVHHPFFCNAALEEFGEAHRLGQEQIDWKAFAEAFQTRPHAHQLSSDFFSCFPHERVSPLLAGRFASGQLSQAQAEGMLAQRRKSHFPARESVYIARQRRKLLREWVETPRLIRYLCKKRALLSLPDLMRLQGS